MGICLGFQLILQEEGAHVARQAQVLHGVETEIDFNPDSETYREVTNPLRVGRYHSLQVMPTSLAPPSLLSLHITAHDPLRKTPLSFEDLHRKLFGLQYHPESFLTNQGKKSFKTSIMQAWTKSGKSIDHPEPWGIDGAFSTLRLFSNGKIPFRNAYLRRVLDSANILQLKWIPEQSLLDFRLDNFLSETQINEGLIRICLFENCIGLSNRTAESDGKKVVGWL